MKKLSVLVIVLVWVLVFSFVIISCGDDDTGDDDDNDDNDDTSDDDDDATDDDDDDDDDNDNDDDDNDDDDSMRFAVEVIEVSYGLQAGYGQGFFPDNVLGPPAGGGDGAPQATEDELLTLGYGGWIVLRVGREIVDGDGVDFTVFENPFFAGGDPTNCFTETAVVEASDDGTTWHRFPNDYDPDGPGTTPYGNPANFTGIAGVSLVYANPDGGTDPFDPTVSGGDSFDLADVGLSSAKYLKLIDTGHIDRAPGTEIFDDNGDLIDDAGNHFPPSGNKEGFDLDAVAVIHAGDPT